MTAQEFVEKHKGKKAKWNVNSKWQDATIGEAYKNHSQHPLVEVIYDGNKFLASMSNVELADVDRPLTAREFAIMHVGKKARVSGRTLVGRIMDQTYVTHDGFVQLFVSSNPSRTEYFLPRDLELVKDEPVVCGCPMSLGSVYKCELAYKHPLEHKYRDTRKPAGGPSQPLPAPVKSATMSALDRTINAISGISGSHIPSTVQMKELREVIHLLAEHRGYKEKS